MHIQGFASAQTFREAPLTPGGIKREKSPTGRIVRKKSCLSWNFVWNKDKLEEAHQFDGQNLLVAQLSSLCNMVLAAEHNSHNKCMKFTFVLLCFVSKTAENSITSGFGLVTVLLPQRDK